MRTAVTAALAAALLAVSAPLPAQNDTPASPLPLPAPSVAAPEAGVRRPALAAIETWSPALPADSRRPSVLMDGRGRTRPSKAGAVIGAVAGGVSGVVMGVAFVESCDDCNRSIAPALAVGAAGALGGAFVGWVIGKLAEPIPPDPAPAS